MSIVKVTYPEGITLKDFASITAKKLGIDSSEFIEAASSDSILKIFRINRKNAEGFLMPQTYNFYWLQSPYEIVYRLLEEQQKIWENRFAAKAKGRSKIDILTLASIVEAETPVIEERPRVAGLYINRLKMGIKLEADPTVQFALGTKRRLFFKDLEFDSPFNTYKYPGLPPGPINSPSLSSIEAALNPEKNDFLYFVAVGNGSGRHNFARNFAQHKRYKAEYKKNLSRD